MGRGEKVITAGDDENDMSLFQVADIKIAMSHAPERLKEKADLIAPPTQDCGIIHALEMVLNANR
jgi:hydroxymethylpyrimidine pyrophosphatase-like HAD family hydrolase